MKNIHDVAELLMAAWVLGGTDEGVVPPVPTSRGLLDRALKLVLQKGAFPDINNKVYFVDSRIGLQCVELPSILTCAQRAELTVAPNPSYRTTRVSFGRVVAQRLVQRLEVSEEDAAKWGRMLRESVTEARKALEPYPTTVGDAG